MDKTSFRTGAYKGRVRWLRPLAALTLLLLAVQFLIGMLVNFYVELPTDHPGANAPEYFSGVAQGVAWALLHSDLLLVAHVAIGLALGLASLLLIGLAIAARQRAWIIVSLLGMVGIVGAGFNGASFLNYGHDFSSLLMSVGFLLAEIAYALGLYLTR